jgi:predicted AAA+ superfamily ATPase
MYFNRAIEPILLKALKQFPVCILTGARQVGKSTLLKNHLKTYTYVTLDEPLIRELANNDPKLFLSRYKSPLIIDEIQYAPGLLPYIKIIVDENRQTYGQYVLTGSQSFSLMQGVSETLAGRAALFELYPPSFNEIISLPNSLNIYDVNHVVKQIIKGFYPELLTVPTIDYKTWYASYLATYIERDVRQLIKIVDLNRFQTFISLLATRAGQLFNISEISKECGVSSPTIKAWLSALEASYIIYLLKPYSKNTSKKIS